MIHRSIAGSQVGTARPSKINNLHITTSRDTMSWHEFQGCPDWHCQPHRHTPVDSPCEATCQEQLSWVFTELGTASPTFTDKNKGWGQYRWHGSNFCILQRPDGGRAAAGLRSSCTAVHRKLLHLLSENSTRLAEMHTGSSPVKDTGQKETCHSTRSQRESSYDSLLPKDWSQVIKGRK